jgi:hypothetical protein
MERLSPSGRQSRASLSAILLRKGSRPPSEDTGTCDCSAPRGQHTRGPGPDPLQVCEPLVRFTELGGAADTTA